MALPQRASRQLAVILFTDIVGYTTLMQQAEEEALSRLQRFKTVLEQHALPHEGTIIQYYGDGCLLLFKSALQAARFAMEIQQAFQMDPFLPVRIGLHAGEVTLKDGLVFGDTVNQASRIESLGAPGSILLSETVRNQLRNQPEILMVAIGAFHFKNIEDPVTLYAISNEGLTVPIPSEMEGKLDTTAKGRRVAGEGISRKGKLYSFLGILTLLWLGWWVFLKPAKEHFMGKPWENSIAILPFENLSGEHEMEYMALSISDEIRTRLASIPSLKVISRTSCMYVKNREQSLPLIGEKLQAAYILEGTVQRSDQRIKISIHMSDAALDQLTWAPVYERSEEDLFRIQEEIAFDIVTQLEPQLSRREKRKLDRQLSVGSVTYDLYLRGMDELATVSAEGISSGKRMLEGLVQGMKSNPSPMSNLAWVTTLSGWGGVSPSGVSDRDSIRLAAAGYIAEAVQSEPEMVYLHSVQAALHWYMDWDASAAERHARLAIQQGDEKGYALLADVLIRTGRTAEAMAVTSHAAALDPLNPDWTYRQGWINLVREHWSEADSCFRVGFASEMPHRGSVAGGAVALMMGDNPGGVVALMDSVYGLGWHLDLRSYAYKVIALYKDNQHDRAFRLLRDLKSAAETSREPDAAYAAACAFTGINLHQEGLRWLRISAEIRDMAFLDVTIEPVFKVLHHYPDWTAILQQEAPGLIVGRKK